MRILLFILFLLVQIYAKPISKLIITADSFIADEAKKITTFNGHVIVKKNKDKIEADTIIVKFDKNNRPIKYIAKKNVHFIIHLKKSYYDGKCQKLTFTPTNKLYTLEGSVNIKEYPANRKISASKVIINALLEKTQIEGSKNKPVKFIFEIKD